VSAGGRVVGVGAATTSAMRIQNSTPTTLT
jgi:hypothetical protein